MSSDERAAEAPAECIDVLARAFREADRNRTGALIAVDLAGRVVAANQRAREVFGEFDVIPLSSSASIVGLLLAGTEREDEVPARVSAVRDGRILLLPPEEIRYAEAARHDVWLVTDHGRVRANTHGIENIERELDLFGFMRVHRSYLVNLKRVRAVHNHGKGVLTLSTLAHGHERIPVSRRCSVALRQKLGL
jgi:DNA-binding LytR/AlgR family response regulator